MLAVALAAKVHNANWKEKLLEDSHCPAWKVVAAIQEVQTQSWLDLLQTIVLRCSVSCAASVRLCWQAYV